jgi:hypothetical protein
MQSRVFYKFNTKFLELLNIENTLYDYNKLRIVLSSKLKIHNKSENTYLLPQNLREFLHVNNNYINIDKLTTSIIVLYAIDNKYPDCYYYHYSEVANYNNI